MTCKRTGRRPPRRLRLALDSLAFGGDAVGRAADGRVVFVPGGAPGDDVEVEVEDEHRSYIRAELSRVVRPGAARVEPPCAQFHAGCGGCQWQHVAVAAQRAAKEEVVRRALRHVDVEVAALRTPAPEYGWRRRARLRWRRGVIGYTRRRAHDLVEVPACAQLEPALEAALACVRAALAGRLEGAGELHLLAARDGAVHVALDGPGVDGLRPHAEALIGQAGIRGVVLGAEAIGADRIDLGDDAAPFWARADLFAQASAPGNDLLRALIGEAAGGLAGARVLELHAGSGNFTRDLAAAGAEVVAIEESAAALALAADNLAARGLRADLRVGAAAVPDERFDLVVVDPPRTGLEGELAAALAATPARIVYVSCDPQTLGRDLAALARHPARSAVPVDLMPQTFHVEVVVALGGREG
jgi:23S rRNA (uracil1939-C5)-methyltransferase